MEAHGHFTHTGFSDSLAAKQAMSDRGKSTDGRIKAELTLNLKR